MRRRRKREYEEEEEEEEEETSWEPLGALFGPHGGFLGASRRPLGGLFGRFGGFFGRLRELCSHIGDIMRPSWALLDAIWQSWRPSWAS